MVKMIRHCTYIFVCVFSVVYMEHESSHKVRDVTESTRHVILADNKGHRYTYDTSAHSSTPFAYVVHGK